MKQLVFSLSVILLSFNAKAQLNFNNGAQGLGGNTNPATEIAISASVSTDTICAGTTVTFTVYTDNGCVPAYQWLLNGAPIPGATADTFSTAALATNDTISVEAAASPGCGLPAAVVSNGIGFNVTSAPAAPGAISGNIAPCTGTAGIYSIAPVAGAAAYIWSVPSGWAGNSKDTSILLTTGNSGAIMVTAVNACGSSQQGVLYVSAQAVPPAPAFVAGNPVVCAGSPESYTVHGPGWSNFAWTLPSGWSGVSNGNSIQCIAGNSGGIISVIATSACGASSTISLPVNANAYVTPAASISTASTAICAGAPATFIASSTNGGNMPDYQWMLNGSALNASGASFTIDSLKTGDVVKAILTSSEQCVSVNGVLSNQITMNILPVVVPDVRISASRTMPVPAGMPVTFTAAYSGGGAKPRFQWLRNGLPIAFETNQTYTAANPAHGDTISVRMTTSAACPAQTEVTSDGITISRAVATGVGQATGTWSGTVTLYPNPSNGRFSIVGNWGLGHQGQDVHVELLNMMGQPVYSASLTPNGAEWRLDVQAGDRLADGMYQLRLRTQDMQVTRPLVIQR
jgi:hypothetical protein